jgi:hypothetical protein
MLQELAEIGMRLARTVDRHASAPATTEDQAATLALVFSRVARAVRQTVALEVRLAEDHRTREKQSDAERAIVAEQERIRGKKRAVKRIVEQAIEREANGALVAEAMRIDLYERLEDADDAMFGDRPIGVTIARICDDLNLPFDPSLWQGLNDAGEDAEAKSTDTSAVVVSDPPPIAVPAPSEFPLSGDGQSPPLPPRPGRSGGRWAGQARVGRHDDAVKGNRAQTANCTPHDTAPGTGAPFLLRLPRHPISGGTHVGQGERSCLRLGPGLPSSRRRDRRASSA